MEFSLSLPVVTDSTIKDHVRKYLTSSNNHHQPDISSYPNIPTPTSPVINTNSIGRGHRISSSDSSACRKSRIPVNHTRASSISAPQSPQTVKPRYSSHIPTANGVSPIVQKKQQPRFEAYMMTGDLILNLSRTPQSSGLLPQQAKKVDSLRDSPARSLKRRNGTAPKAIYDSSPSESSSPSISDIVSHQENVESNNNNNRKNSKLSKMITSGDSRLGSINNSVDEEEEQLILDGSSAEHSLSDERKKKFNSIINSGCVNNTSSSSSTGSSPTNTNTNSSNSSPNMHENYDGGGGGVGGGGSDNGDVGSSRSGQKKNQKYSVLENEENHQQQKQKQLEAQRKHLNVTPSASMSSTTSSASTTINRSETLLTPTPDVSHSVPTSPTSISTPLLDVAKRRELASSVPTSPECNQVDVVQRRNSHQQQNGVCVRKIDASGFRTSRSEDHLQLSQREGTMGNAIPIDIDEDVNSSLNTLLDTRHDSDGSPNSDRDRIVWTYNAPVPPNPNQQGVLSPTSHSSSISTSPQHTDSPASPTSVSSSVMSSSGSKGNGLGHTANGGLHGLMFLSGEQSVSEAISNISSPDYQDEHDLLSTRDLSAAMAISDPSDSDSTLIVDNLPDKDHKVVIQVEGRRCSDMMNSEDELATLTDEPMSLNLGNQREASPPVSDDGSDVDSLHSFHYSPKAVDIPSAVRLAKRLFTLDGFKKSDVSRHLSKKCVFRP
jgi:PH and SEC7 domain-containing protein